MPAAPGLGMVMRVAAGLLSIATVLLTASLAHAAAPADARARAALVKAVFAPRTTSPAALVLAPRSDLSAVSTGQVFLPTDEVAVSPDSVRLLAPDLPVAGQGLAQWRSNEVTLPPTETGAVDSVRVSLGSVAYAPGGYVLARPDALVGVDTQAFDVRYTRGWPAALQLSAGDYDVDFSPHAGVGVSSGGGSAEAGGMVRVGSNLQDKVMSSLDHMGLHTVSSRSIEDRGRWYLFASASGRAVGLNMGRDAQGNMQRLGWSAEGTSALISDAQAGIAWRKGATEASIGYVHRDIHGDFGGSVDPGHVKDSMVAFSFSVRPR